MPKQVKRTKTSMSLSVAITSLVLILIPVLIILFTGTASFEKPYGIYMLASSIIVAYFAIIMGMLAWRNKILYLILDIINIVVAVGFIIYAYINSNYQGGLLLHIAAALFLTLSFYQTGDVDQGDSYFMRYMVPVALDIAGLIFVLWFISVDMSVIVHIVLVSIFNAFNLLIFFIPSLVKLISNRQEFFSGLSNRHVEYEEETEEEIKERKEAKATEKALKEEQLRQEIKQQQEELHANDVHNAGNHSKWIPFPSTIEHLIWHIDFEFNKIVEHINEDIKWNNRIIDPDSSDSLQTKKDAVKSNKQITNGIKYMRKNVRKMKKNLAELGNHVFTREDCYKEFTFNPLSGKMKVRPSKSETPVLEILSYKLYFTYIHNLSYKQVKQTLEFEGEADCYLKPID